MAANKTLVVSKEEASTVLGIELLSWFEEHPVVSKMSSGAAHGKVSLPSSGSGSFVG